MKYFVFFRSGISGGTGTLAIRLTKHIKENYDKIYYILEEFNDNLNEKYLLDENVVFLHKAKIASIFEKDSEIDILCYTLQEYINAAFLFKKYPNKVMLLYPLSNALTGATFEGRKILSFLSRILTRRYFKRLYYSDCILFTGAIRHDMYTKYYRIPRRNVHDFFYVPIDISAIEDCEIEHRYLSKPRVIISILRTEFPLKGYIFGLIDDFKRLLDNGHDINLRIIASGENITMIYDAVVKAGIMEKCQIISGCSYRELKHYIRESFLNVGHGTSVKDAASVCVPSIVAADMCYSNKTEGFYADIKKIITYEDISFHTFYECIETMCSLSYDDYYNYCLRDYSLVRDTSSIESFCVKLQNRINSMRGKRVKYFCLPYYIKCYIESFLVKMHKK